MIAEPRQTKIVATLGPASDLLIEQLVVAGVDVFRLNFSHGGHDEQAVRIREVRRAAAAVGRFVAVIADLQGPKIRIGGFADCVGVDLVEDARFVIDASLDDAAGDVDRVGTSYRVLPQEVAVGDLLVLGDGLVQLEVERVEGCNVHTRVRAGGYVGAHYGINKRGGGLSAQALTEKDVADLRFARDQGVDFIAVSFPRTAADMNHARKLLDEQGVAGCRLIAKLERAEVVASSEVLDDLIHASDAVMVARGDLGIEIGDARLVGEQKHIIARARSLNCPVITATQMMESMIRNPRPTRAEVMDVANAVFDGTDAVMLSGETAIGRYPLQTVEAMVEIIRGAEVSAAVMPAAPNALSCVAIDDAIALAAMTAAGHLSGVRAVACLTASGNTPQLMSRQRIRMPIYALAGDPRTLARMALLRGVHPVHFDANDVDFDLIHQTAVTWLQRAGVVAPGDRVIFSWGDRRDVRGSTNTLKIMEVQ